MASYNELLALIDAYINQNGVQAITGQVLNGVLRAMVDQLGRGYAIMGAADPTTDPGTPDGPETWFASVPGTYTNFDGIQIVPGELALLSYVPSDGFSKNTIYEGFQTVQATADDNIGYPQVGVSYANGVLSFDFRNIKGEPGENGQDGDPAGFGTVNATVDDQVGTPSVSVSSSGPDTAKNFTFAFRNLKGETGVTSVLATVDNTSGNPQCAVSLQNGQLTLAFTGLKGAQGDTGSSVDYPFTIVNNLTTNDATQALSAAMGVQLESEVSQLEAKVDDLSTGKYYGYFAKEEDLPEADVDGFAYVGEGPTYTIYNLRGDVWTSSDITVNQSPIGNDEDIDQNEDGKLQFANRVYNAQQPNGMGYKILRKDASFASQVTDTNTIYEIRYDFDINSATVTIPAGCILKFNGGEIVNGTINGNWTEIEASAVLIFSGITISGTWNVGKIMSTWFSKDKYTIGNLLMMNNASIKTEIIINGDYDVYIPNASGSYGLNILGNTIVEINGTLTKDASSPSAVSAMFTINGDNVKIIGGIVDGNKSQFDTLSEYGHGFDIKASNCVDIIGVTIKNCRGDGIYSGGETTSERITVKSCEIVGCRRNGIALINSNVVSIVDTYIHDINGVSPKSAIDLEPNSGTQLVKNININNCIVEECGQFLTISGRADSHITEVFVNNTAVKFTSFHSCVTLSYYKNVLFQNCDFILSGRTGSYAFSASNSDNDVRFEHCSIVDITATGTLIGMRGIFEDCILQFGSYMQITLSGTFFRCSMSGGTSLCDKGGTLGATIDGCTISVPKLNISGTSTNPAKGYIIRNSNITTNSNNYPLQAQYVENIQIYDNVLSLKGDRNLLNFTYAKNVSINNNRIVIGSNNNGIVFDANSSECEANGNIFEVASGVTWTLSKYSGINSTTPTANKIGVPFYLETSIKMAMYNGTSVVNMDGSAII